MEKGTVSGFSTRTEQVWSAGRQRMMIVWNFRLERKDAAGNFMPRIAVEMRGLSIEGSILNGDVVEINAKPVEGQQLRVNVVRNLSTGTTVRATGAPRPGRSLGGGILTALFFLFKAIFLLTVLGIAAFVLNALLTW